MFTTHCNDHDLSNNLFHSAQNSCVLTEMLICLMNFQVVTLNPPRRRKHVSVDLDNVD